MRLKRLAALFIVIALLLGIPVGAAGLTVYPFEETGQRLVCGGEEQSVSAYNINGNNYFKLRDIVALMGASVHWDEASQTIELAAAGELSFSPIRNPELDFGIRSDENSSEYIICDYCFSPGGTLLLLQRDGKIFEYDMNGQLLGGYDMELEAKGLTAFRIAAGEGGRIALLDGHNNAIITATREGVTAVGRMGKDSGPDDVGLVENFDLNPDGTILITWSGLEYGYAADVAVEKGEVLVKKRYPNMGRRVPGAYGINVISPVETLGTKELYAEVFRGETAVDRFTLNAERDGLYLTAFVLYGVTEEVYLAKLIYLEDNRFKSQWVLVDRTGDTRDIMALESSLTGGESFRYLDTELWYSQRSEDYLCIAPLSDGLGKSTPWVGDFSACAESAASASSVELTIYPFAETGQRIVCGGEEQQVSAYNINGNNYFKLRDIAALLGAQVSWDGSSKILEIVP